MVRLVTLVGASAVVLAAVASATADFTITFTNKCSANIDLYARLASIFTDKNETIVPGASVVKTIGKGYEGHFRNGLSDAATLIEIATKGDLDLVWFDIGIIPPHLKPGFEYCKSLEECKKNSDSGIGFNTPVQITPTSNTNGKNCRELTCLADACEDAYNFPQDDTKTHSCPFGTNFIVTFCPTGDSKQQGQTTSMGSSSTNPEADDPTQKDTPASDYPTQENTPTVESPAQENTPASDDPTQKDTPASDYLTQENTPTVESPAQENTPASDDPTQKDTPASDYLTQENAPTDESPAQENTPASDDPTQKDTPDSDYLTQENTPTDESPAQDNTPASDYPTQDDVPSVETPGQEDTPSSDSPTHDDAVNGDSDSVVPGATPAPTSLSNKHCA